MEMNIICLHLNELAAFALFDNEKLSVANIKSKKRGSKIEYSNNNDLKRCVWPYT